ncbi:hypothetical protein [Plantactinospora sp. KBS50]|uniref:hypothetical protein n=1 Tax=Plantactinospora sp. KBS50 TaxID=2024580 RepID=UPI000BAAEAE4|nr:hypothetical protein [Plantactinospora sp. KBS50]ASW55141.1 hypothetical protein CIK06_14625 [Plantactinospora sp. KBS50]
MGRHDEPNEYGFSGGATAPQPPPRGQQDERDAAERVAVPGDDLTTEFDAMLPGGADRDEDEDRPGRR